MSGMVPGPSPDFVKPGCGSGVNRRRRATGSRPVSRLLQGRRPTGPGRGPSWAAPTGSSTMTTSPSPGADAAETVPPWAATMAATMDSPSPLPPACATGPHRHGRSARTPAGRPRRACPGRCPALRSAPGRRPGRRARWRRSRTACAPARWPTDCRGPGAADPCRRSPRPDERPRSARATRGPTAVAVWTASEATDTSSTGAVFMGTPSSSRARVRRSLTSRSMRAVSVRMPETMRGRSSECWDPPRSNSSA